MSHEWYAGVLNASSWHGLEEVGALVGADGAIDAGERSGAWPVALEYETILTASGLPVPDRSAIVASYRGQQSRAVIGDVGARYHATTPDRWRMLVRAAVDAGAKPTGAFALRGGSVVLATFEVGQSNGLRTQLLLADAFDGSMKLTAGTTAVRVVCANTLSMAMRSDGKDMAALRHTASLDGKAALLADTIGSAIAHGATVRERYQAAESMRLDRTAARVVFDALFPEAPADAPQATKTRIENIRSDAHRVAAMPINNAGASLATVWNAATYLVDRNADGTRRPVRSGDQLDSMVFGARGKRIADIEAVIDTALTDLDALRAEAEAAAEERQTAKRVRFVDAFDAQ